MSHDQNIYSPPLTKREKWLRKRYKDSFKDMLNDPLDEEKKRTFEMLAIMWGRIVSYRYKERLIANGEIEE